MRNITLIQNLKIIYFVIAIKCTVVCCALPAFKRAIDLKIKLSKIL